MPNLTGSVTFRVPPDDAVVNAFLGIDPVTPNAEPSDDPVTTGDDKILREFSGDDFEYVEGELLQDPETGSRYGTLIFKHR